LPIALKGLLLTQFLGFPLKICQSDLRAKAFLTFNIKVAIVNRPDLIMRLLRMWALTIIIATGTEKMEAVVCRMGLGLLHQTIACRAIAC
jgi:hypothetical protein